MPSLHKSVQDTPVFDTFCLKQLQSWSSVACQGCPNATCFDGHLCAQTCCLSWTNFNEHICPTSKHCSDQGGHSYQSCLSRCRCPCWCRSPPEGMESTVRGGCQYPFKRQQEGQVLQTAVQAKISQWPVPHSKVKRHNTKVKRTPTLDGWAGISQLSPPQYLSTSRLGLG